MTVKRIFSAFLFLAAFCWAAPGLYAARMASASFLDVNGIYAYGSAYMVSANYEGSANLQEVSVSTQESAGYSHRSGKLSFSPFPASVFDLTPVTVSSSGIRITWTAPSADISRAAEPAESYLLRYSSAGFISTDEGFYSAPVYAQTWTPLAAGAAESRIIEGFNPGTTYYFALETINSHGIRSELSNPAAAFALAPLAPMNFQLVRAGNSVTLTWVSPAGYQSRIPFNNRFSPSYPYEIKKYEVYRATAPADA
ncbi:MAG: fibronectin type III domain-containing protein, partial [Elusimicrobiota bacterium]|nr:fibronectin type III domain-containing protein [Elusimicrobiota bacterium]